MSIKTSLALANALLKGGTINDKLAGGFIYIYAGTEPASADDVLDLTPTTGTHTQLAKIAADSPPVDSGVTGLTFAASASARALAKNGAETWASKVNFVGKDQASAGVSPLTATFFRFVNSADNGHVVGDATTFRLQGSVGTSGTDMVLASVALSDNGSNTVGLATAEVREP
jgi:hypothetical protein